MYKNFTHIQEIGTKTNTQKKWNQIKKIRLTLDKTTQNLCEITQNHPCAYNVKKRHPKKKNKTTHLSLKPFKQTQTQHTVHSTQHTAHISKKNTHKKIQT